MKKIVIFTLSAIIVLMAAFLTVQAGKRKAGQERYYPSLNSAKDSSTISNSLAVFYLQQENDWLEEQLALQKDQLNEALSAFCIIVFILVAGTVAMGIRLLRLRDKLKKMDEENRQLHFNAYQID